MTFIEDKYNDLLCSRVQWLFQFEVQHAQILAGENADWKLKTTWDGKLCKNY